MSVSQINATTAPMAAAAAIAQAQATQYSNHFAALQEAVDSGDLKEARQALVAFQKDSAVATANGYDPVNQTLALRQDFSALRKALAIGDVRSAKSALSDLRKEMGAEVVPSIRSGTEVPPVVGQSTLSVPSTSIPMGGGGIARENSKGLGKNLGQGLAVASADAPRLSVPNQALRDIRTVQFALALQDSQKPGATSIQLAPAMTSFAQAPQVFPTSAESGDRLFVKTSIQAELHNALPGIELSMPGGQPSNSGGTSFAPTPELLLGSKGMTIPPGADVRFSRDLVLLKGMSVGN